MTIYNTFLKLLDTPVTGSYAGNAGMGVAVNAAEDALEFVGIFVDGGESMGVDRTLGNTDNYDLGFLTNNANRLHIQNDGKIGIGTTSPNYALDVLGDISMIGNATNADRTLHFASDAYLWWDESEDAFYLYHDKPLFIGQMGFGGPDEMLHVFQQNSVYVMIETDRGDAGLKLNNSGGSGESKVIFQEFSSTKWELLYSITDDELRFYNDVLDINQLVLTDGGNVGIKGDPNVDLEIFGADDPALRINETGDTGSHFGITQIAATQSQITHVASSGNMALIDFDPNPLDGTSIAAFRFFRSTNTSGLVYAQFFIGDGSGTSQAVIGASGIDSYFCADNGKMGIGLTGPAAKLHVDQPSASGAIPVLALDQADLSDEFINFICASTGAGDPVDTSTAVGSTYARLRIAVNGTYKYIKLYNA
jgi:hypothetical protein